MTDRHVTPADDGWQVTKEHAKRPSAKTTTQAEAITRATQIVTNDGGGQVIIHGTDGQERETRTITTDDTDTDTGTSLGTSEAGDAATGNPRSGNSRAEHTTAGHEHRTPNTTHHSAAADGAHPRARRAAHSAAHRNSLHLDIPLLGTVALPPPDQLAYLGGITALVAVGILEWPIAALIGAGHLLASTRNNKILADFGEALEQA
jgi:hypothetical protein